MSVRREAVLLEVEGNFVSEMTKAAGAAALLKRELDGLDGTNARASRSFGDVEKSSTRATRAAKEYNLETAIADEKASRLRKSLQEQARAAVDAEAGLGGLRKTTGDTGKEIDKLSGRVTILRDVALTLGPGLIPIGAAAIPAVVGLTGAFGAAAAGAGVAIAAFHGMGDALKALDAYQLEPTKKNLEALQEQMDKLGPAGAEFVRFIDSLEPQLRSLQMAAREGLLPGVEEGLTSMLRLMPQARRIVFDLATEMGDLSAAAGDALSGPRFEAFFNYLETDAAPIMGMFARSLGNIVEGFANLVVAFGPLTRDFNGGLESMTASFARWSSGLAGANGFQEFVAYIRESGPQVVDLIGAISSALVGIISAAAPIGHVVLPVLTALANIIGDLASSPLGAPFFAAVAGVLAFSRAASALNATLKAVKASAIVAGGSLTSAKVGMAGFTLAAIAAAASNGDLSKALRDVNTQLALGNLEQARANLNKVNAELARFKDFRTVSGVGDLFGDLGNVFKNPIESLDFTLRDVAGSGFDGARDSAALLEKQIADAEAATRGYASAADEAAAASGRSKTQIEGLARAMEEQRAAALSSFDANTRYGEAVDAAAAAAAKGARGISASSKAGRENRDALSALAAAWNNQSDAVRNNAGAYANARANFIKTAVQMGATRAQARALARQLLEVPDKVLVKVKLDGGEAARSAIARLKRDLASVPRSIRTTYYVNQINGINKRAANPGMLGPGSADGSTVPKTGLPYADRHPYLLADGEEVISNRYGQADRHRALLKAINANRLAGGGTVGSGIGTAASAGIGTATSLEFYVSVRGLSRALKEASTWSKSETNQRKKMLLGMLAREKAEAESLKRRLDFYRQERAQLTSAVQNRLRTNIFDQPDQQAQAYRQLDRPDNFAQLTPEQQKQFAQTEYQLNQSLGFGQQQAGTSPASALWGDIKNAQEMKTLIRKLKWRGLNGAALSDLLQNASMDQIRALANGSKADVAQYERLYNTRDRLTQQVAGQAGSAAFGDQIRVLAKKYDESLAMQKAIERENRLANSRLRAIEAAAKKIEDATKKVGKDVGREINNAARAGSRGRST